MNSQDPVNLLNEFAMAVLEHTYMTVGRVMLEAEGRKPDESTAAKMKEIREGAVQKATTIATTVLTELLHRPPTAEELQAVLTPALDDRPPSWEWLPEQN